MSRFVINGRKPVSGSIYPAGSKNAILPIIAATLLTNESCHIEGVPAISDVRVMLRLIEDFGALWNLSNYGEDLIIDSSHVHGNEIDRENFSKIRGSNILIGPLLARFGSIKGYYPGGDNIGKRSMHAHFDVFTQSGYIVAENKEDESYTICKNPDFNHDDVCIFMYEPSVTATENAILINVLGHGKVVIENAACEPHIRDLCVFLKKMGADISGEGTNRININKVESLHGATHYLVRDHVYIGSFIVFALVTNGDIYIENVDVQDLQPILTLFKYFNVVWELNGNSLHIPANQELHINDEFDIYSNVGIYSEAWPKFPTDLLPAIITLATQSEGSFLFFEKMFADRIQFSEGLRVLGADITLLDNHRIIVKGKTSLHGGQLACPDIRSGIMYLTGMLAAEGQSVLENIAHIERAYPKIETILQGLGVDIKKYEDTI